MSVWLHVFFIHRSSARQVVVRADVNAVHVRRREQGGLRCRRGRARRGSVVFRRSPLQGRAEAQHQRREILQPTQ
eukprot:COSAG04_NODE_30714_length_261_cov_0.635802_1_plen_74_part_01